MQCWSAAHHTKLENTLYNIVHAHFHMARALRVVVWMRFVCAYAITTRVVLCASFGTWNSRDSRHIVSNILLCMNWEQKWAQEEGLFFFFFFGFFLGGGLGGPFGAPHDSHVFVGSNIIIPFVQKIVNNNKQAQESLWPFDPLYIWNSHFGSDFVIALWWPTSFLSNSLDFKLNTR
jgi:hypothetical protein